jgi:hypothetical protein
MWTWSYAFVGFIGLIQLYAVVGFIGLIRLYTVVGLIGLIWYMLL